jgi:hypothetical protein
MPAWTASTRPAEVCRRLEDEAFVSSETGEMRSEPVNAGRSPVLDERYLLDPGTRLPELDSPHAEAYAARDLRFPDRPLFALFCRRDLLPRMDVLERFARLDRAKIIKPLQWGAVDWAPAGERRYAVVFRRPGGERVVSDPQRAFQPMRPEDLKRKVIAPLLPLFQDLGDRLLTHRAIRPENLFYMDNGRGEAMLGECVSAPPGLMQPAIYETIENGMAEPAGRSSGNPADDLYAFGVLLAVLLTGETPCAGMSDHQIVSAKLGAGSYTAMFGKARIPLAMLEPLRGLLCDDEHERWNAGDLKTWLGGGPPTFKQPAQQPKAARPFRFAGSDYWDARSLGFALANNWSKAAQRIQDGKIAGWVLRSLGDEERAARIGEVLRRGREASDSGTGGDRTLASVLAALDSRAPLRYKGLAASPDALGRALAINYHQAERIQLFAELLQGRSPLVWFESQQSSRPELLSIKKTIEQACAFVDQSRWGFGIERCLYLLNPVWPCQSPILAQEYVCHIKELLPALERVAQQGIPATEPVDRHVAAFCAARTRHVPERHLKNLSSERLHTRHLAMLHVLADVQQRFGPARLPALARWFAGLLAPIIETYHSRPYRKQLSGQLESLLKGGALLPLCALFDNSGARLADEQAFAAARLRYRQIAAQIAWLQQGGLSGRDNVLRVSRHAAGIISATLAGLMLVAMTLFYVL